MKTIKQLLKKGFGKLIFWYNSAIRNPLHLKRMVRKANKLHLMTGKRYFVVPKTDTSLMVVDNTYIKHYNKAIKNVRGYKKINIKDLIEMAYYATSVQSIVR